MEFYNDKLVFHRKQSHLTSGKIASAMNISRTTYWKWEKGIRTPNTKQVRIVAKILDISVSDISDLPPLPGSVNTKGTGLSENVDSWLSFFDLRENKSFQTTIAETLNASIKLSNKLTEAGIIIKALLTGIDSIFYVKNNELLYLTANVAFLKNISLKPSFTVFGKTDEDFFSKKEANDNSYKDEQVLITKKQSVEEGFIPGSKKKKWGIITRIPIFDLNDNVMGIITNVMDITNRKKSEYYNELLRTCLENMPNTAVSIYNLKAANMVYANEMATKLSGYSLDEICDKKSDLALNVLCSPEEKAKSQEYRKSGIWPKDRELQIKCKDGTVKWILETNSQVTDFMNSEYMVGIATDITEEKNQSKQNSAFSNLFDYANIGIKLRNDTTGEIFFINKHFGSIFGHPNEKFMKKDKFRIENCVHSEDKERESEYYKSNRYPKVRDYRIIRADGELRYIREVSFQADYAEEKYSGCICRDITESDASGIINPYKTAKILKDENVDISIISRACGLSEEIIKGI